MRITDINKLYADFTTLEQTGELAKLENVHLIGWVKHNRNNNTLGFIDLNDGTALKNVQVVYKQHQLINYDSVCKLKIGSAILVSGLVKQSDKTTEQPFEVHAQEVKILALSENDFPLQKKQHSRDFLRTISHLRHRTTFYSAVMRVRSRLVYAIHNFFDGLGFINVNTPILTVNDCEGAGEAFSVTPDLFSDKTYLSVSGQLHAEAYALGFKRVYTFNPAFRAEKSNTSKHLSEFWMLEPELAFANLQDVMHLVEGLMKYLIDVLFKFCPDELAYFERFNDQSLTARLKQVLSTPFKKISYRKTLEILRKAVEEGKQFEDNNLIFGMDLKTEHERFLAEEVFKGPVFVHNYPKQIKAFYMSTDETDEETVKATDLLIPGVGELVGGSERNADYDLLLKRCYEENINVKELQWYLDLRKYGYYKSAGFGLGFERLLMYFCAVENIKDVIPFARTAGSIDF